MSAKSGINLDISESSDHSGSTDPYVQANIDMVAQNIYTHYTPNVTSNQFHEPNEPLNQKLKSEAEAEIDNDQKGNSPSVFRRSLTLDYDCDWKKSSTMPHDYNRLRKDFLIFGKDIFIINLISLLHRFFKVCNRLKPIPYYLV